VLLSSGLDSTVNLFQSNKETEISLALTFDYGQRAAEAEIRCSSLLCKKLHVEHKTVRLDFFKTWGHSSLVDHEKKLPLKDHVHLNDAAISAASAKSVWVPNRNGVFLNIAAGFAESLGCDFVIPGFNREEAATFPDNSSDFLNSLNQSFSYSTANHVKVRCFTSELDKIEIVALGKTLGVPWELTWPCYQNLGRWCGQCESCQRAKRAFSANGVQLENFMD
jgi:7-cyano-7-deazaguanine synthase